MSAEYDPLCYNLMQLLDTVRPERQFRCDRGSELLVSMLNDDIKKALDQQRI